MLLMRLHLKFKYNLKILVEKYFKIGTQKTFLKECRTPTGNLIYKYLLILSEIKFKNLILKFIKMNFNDNLNKYIAFL